VDGGWWNQKEVALSFQGLDPDVGIVFEILLELSNVVKIAGSFSDPEIPSKHPVKPNIFLLENCLIMLHS